MKKTDEKNNTVKQQQYLLKKKNYSIFLAYLIGFRCHKWQFVMRRQDLPDDFIGVVKLELGPTKVMRIASASQIGLGSHLNK